MKGLMKAAFYDPNPVVMLEHKGLYWSKVSGTEEAKRKEEENREFSETSEDPRDHVVKEDLALRLLQERVLPVVARRLR